MADYFDKELTFVKQQYVEGLRRAVDDDKTNSKVTPATLLSMPKLKAEKLKSIPALVSTVANGRYLGSIFTITTDAAMRMESIGRDDKNLAMHLKDLFILQLSFMVDGIFLPWTQACTIMLLKHSGSKTVPPTLPPMEFLDALSALQMGVNRLKSHFDDTFAKPIGTMPNVVVFCKESRRSSIKVVEKTARESLHAWTLCIGLFVERTLSSMQQKTDYLKPDPIPGVPVPKNPVIKASEASGAVCRALLQVANSIRKHEQDLAGVNLLENFWKPLGRQIVGSFISHIRRQRINRDGAKVLAKDVDEYYNVS
jgi:Exocyst complex component Sec10